MAKKGTRKTGKPRALEAQEELDERQTPEQFVQEFFPGETAPTGEEVGTSLAIPQPGLPPLRDLKAQYKTKSAAIRYLTSLGHPPKIIAKHLGIRYQHARNVATTELKRGPNEDWRPKPQPQEEPK